VLCRRPGHGEAKNVFRCRKPDLVLQPTSRSRSSLSCCHRFAGEVCSVPSISLRPKITQEGTVKSVENMPGAGAPSRYSS